MKLTEDDWLLYSIALFRGGALRVMGGVGRGVAAGWTALCVMAMALGTLAGGQAISTTTVQGTVYLANGQPASGTVVVSWPTFTSAEGLAVTAGQLTAPIAPDGFVSVNLAANLGATPAGLYYTAHYYLSDGTASTEYWVVPAIAQASLAQVRAQVMPAAQAVQAVNKAYVDQSIAELSTSLLAQSGGTLSGSLFLNGDPTQPLQAADKHYVDETFAQAVPLTGGDVTGALTAQQLGAAYEVDQFPGADFGAKLQACLNGINPTYGGTCDARNFTGTQAMGSNVKVSTANTTIDLPCATIATANQIVVTAGTRNVALKGCALRGSSAASGNQGGTVFEYSGSGAMVQVGDPTYAMDTMGFHMDDAVVSTTVATSAAAQGLVAYRTQELDLESLYFLGNSNQTAMTLDGTGNYTGGTFYDDAFNGFQTAVNAIGHQAANAATTDWMNASTFVRLHIDCPTSGGSPIAGTYGINLQQGDGNTFTGGDVEGCSTALHLGPNAQNNTIVGLRNENSTNQVVADAGSSYNNWTTGGTMYTGALTDNGTRNSFLDSFHRAFNGMKGDWYASQQDATVTNHLRLGTGTGNERGLLNEYQTDYGYRWTIGLGDGTTGAQYYNILDNLSGVNRISVGQYLSATPNVVTNIIVNNGGCYSSSAPATIAFAGGGGSGASATANMTTTASLSCPGGWQVGSVTMVSGGSGYTSQPALSFSGANQVTAPNAIAEITTTGSTNNQTVLNAAGTGAVVLNGSNNAGTGGVVFGSGGPNETTVATINNAGNAQFNGTLQVNGASTFVSTPTVKNQADAEIDYTLWAGLTSSQKESLIYKDWNGNSQWYMVKDASNNWALNSATGGIDSFKAYQSTNSGDTYIDASNSSGVVRVNYESGSGAGFNVYGGNSSSLYASFTGTNAIKFPGLAAGSGHNCLQIDNSGYITNTGAACSTGVGTVGSGNAGQIAYYTASGTSLGGLSTVPVASGGTGAATAAAGLANLGGVPASGGTMTGALTATQFNGPVSGNLTGNVTGNVTGNLSGNASTATALAGTPAQCSAGQVATGVTANGTANCTQVSYTQLAGTVPTWNQNTTGTASNVTGTVATANGGTGATTAAGALANLGAVALTGGTMTGALTATQFNGPLSGNVTGNLTGNVVGNVSGTAANVTGTVQLGNGGTGATTAAAALANLLPGVTSDGANGFGVAGNAQLTGALTVGGATTFAATPTVKNQADAEIDATLWAGLTAPQKESYIFKDWNGNNQWFMVKDASNNWSLNSATGGLDSFKAYQSTNSGDTYIDSSNSSGVVRVNYETGSGTAFNVYGGGSSNLYASFSGTGTIKFPGLAAGSGHSCLQIDSSGYITNTGSACGSGTDSSITISSAPAGQVAYYSGNGSSISGMTTVPISAGGTGATTVSAALANLLPGVNGDSNNGVTVAGNVAAQTTSIVTAPTYQTGNSAGATIGNVRNAAPRSLIEFGASAASSDNTAAIEAALNWEQSGAHGCVYVPAGVYQYQTPIAWTAASELCILGESDQNTVFYYTGSANGSQATNQSNQAVAGGNAAFYVNYGPGVGFSAVRIENIGFAANTNVQYAFEGVQVGEGVMRNVAFSGGSVSSFDGKFWSAQADLTNLNVVPGFMPSSVQWSCVNGLSFETGPDNGGSNYFPSSQFSLTSPRVMNCTGVGLNMVGASGVAVTGAQLSNNYQNLVTGCGIASCGWESNTFNNILLEDGGTGGKVDDQVNDRSVFISLFTSGTEAMDTTAQSEYINSELNLKALSGRGPMVINSTLGTVSDQSVDGIQYFHNVSTNGGGTTVNEQKSFYAVPTGGCNISPIQATYLFNNQGNGTYTLSTVPVNINSNHWTAWVHGMLTEGTANVAAPATDIELNAYNPAITFADGSTITLSQSSSGLTWTIAGVNGTVGGIVSVDFYPAEECGYSFPASGTQFSRPVKLPISIANGTQTVSGCSLTSAVGGASAGQFNSGSSGACTVTITPGVTAPNGFRCEATDMTTPADQIGQTANTTTTCTISGTTASGDKITWQAIAF